MSEIPARGLECGFSRCAAAVVVAAVAALGPGSWRAMWLFALAVEVFLVSNHCMQCRPVCGTARLDIGSSRAGYDVVCALWKPPTQILCFITSSGCRLIGLWRDICTVNIHRAERITYGLLGQHPSLLRGTCLTGSERLGTSSSPRLHWAPDNHNCMAPRPTTIVASTLDAVTDKHCYQKPVFI